MKSTLGLCLATSILLFYGTSCKEIGSQITKNQTALKDTTYMTSVPANKDARITLIEEFTGGKCVNCPTGHDMVKSAITTYPNKVAAIAYHKFGSVLDEPAHLGQAGFDATKDDYRREEATNIMNAIFGSVNSIPKAGFDRVYDGTNNFFSLGEWPGKVAARVATPSGINLATEWVLATDKKSGVLTVKGIYTQANSQKQVLNVILTESHLESAQYGTSGVMENYVHEHIFRKAYTPAAGRPILNSLAAIEPGRAFEVSLQLDFETLWNLNNCEIIAFVANNGQTDKTVQQTAIVKVIP